MGDEHKKMADYWMIKAERSLNAAENELEQQNYDFCANRLYYAAFYAVSAVLINKNQFYKKHSGIRAAFHMQFIKTGILPVEYGVLYDALLRDREEADYIAFAELDPEVLAKEIIQTKALVSRLQQILNGERGGQFSLTKPPT